jgi:membrane protease YdiL (CAAX protease family)
MESTSREPARDRPLAVRLRGLGPLSWLAFLVILAGTALTPGVGALLVIGWAALSGTPRRELGLVAPRRWLLTALGGIAVGVVFKLAMKSVVMPLLGAPPVNQAYHFLEGNRAAFHWMVPMVLFSAAFGEEVLFRGYLFERLGRILGRSAAATVATVILTSALFAAAHYGGQGVPGVQQALVTGLVFAALFARTRALPFLMVAHAAFDLTAMWLIFHGLETTVAHWFFR